MPNPLPINETEEAQAKLCDETGRIRRTVAVSLRDGDRFPSLNVAVEQLYPGEDSWEVIFSQDSSVFGVLYFDAISLKQLADLFGEMARTASKIKRED